MKGKIASISCPDRGLIADIELESLSPSHRFGLKLSLNCMIVCFRSLLIICVVSTSLRAAS